MAKQTGSVADSIRAALASMGIDAKAREIGDWVIANNHAMKGAVEKKSFASQVHQVRTALKKKEGAGLEAKAPAPASNRRAEPAPAAMPAAFSDQLRALGGILGSDEALRLCQTILKG